jgi:TrmH family RNA methyltransferase
MIHKKITSLSNPLIGKAVDVVKRRHNVVKNVFLAEGPNLVGMAASAGAAIEEVFYTENFIRTEEGRGLLEQLSNMPSPPGTLAEVTEKILSRISDTESPQGIVATVSHVAVNLYDLQLKSEPLLAACDGIQDPGNMGAIIRVSDAAGADAVVVLPGTCDPFSPKTVRATAGSVFNVPIVFTGHADFIDYLKSRNLDLLVTDVRARRSLYESDLKKAFALVFGNEARGVSDVLLKCASGAIRIPIQGKAESLNVATAAAICLYETVRQRITK